MADNKINFNEFMKEAAANGVELTDDMLDAISGGRYTYEEWKAMTTLDRLNAMNRSDFHRSQNEPCEPD